MIDTLFFALQIAGIIVLIGWAVIHDRLREGMPTRGPLAFKQDDDLTGSKSGSRRSRFGHESHRTRSGPRRWKD